MSALDQMVGIIPIIAVGGVAMKMTEKLFPQPPQQQPRYSRQQGRRRQDASVSRLGFGNFSNVGIR